MKEHSPLSSQGLTEQRPEPQLDSWKEIANYVKRDVSTVQRWEKREGMPVHRHLHDKRGSVYAFACELDAWLQSRTPNGEQEQVPATPELTTCVPVKHPWSFWQLFIGSVFIVAVAAFATRAILRNRATPPKIRVLAVLPFKNLSRDATQKYLADGMTEELIGRLSGIHDLRVISRTSSMQFNDSRLSVPEIAKELSVDAVVEGSVTREGNRIRVHAQLIRGATDDHFWSGSYERELREVLVLQSDVAQAIANKIEVAVTEKERARLVAARPVPPDAYESNLKGEFVLDYKGNSRADVEQSIGYFQDAISKDPTFALPYVGMGKAYILLSSTMFGGNPRNMHANAMTAAQKALELDPELVDAHLLLAAAEQKQYQWADAEAEYQRALELEPNNPNANFNYGLWFLSQGRIDEALAWARHAGELNPPVNGMGGMGLILFNARRYDESMRNYRDLLAVGSNGTDALWGIGLVLMAKRQADQAIPVLEKAVSVSDRSPGIVGGLVMAYAQAGRRTDALRLLADLKKREQPGYAGALVFGYLGLGDYDEVFIWLDRAYQEQSNIIQFLKVLPFFDPVRDDHRFIELVHRVGLDKS